MSLNEQPGYIVTYYEVRRRPIPVAGAPMVYHLWAAWEKAAHLPEAEAIAARKAISRTLDEVTRA